MKRGVRTAKSILKRNRREKEKEANKDVKTEGIGMIKEETEDNGIETEMSGCR